MTANVTGSFAMGLLMGWLALTLSDTQNELRLFLAIGMLGGFTTFSSFSLDAITLFERGEWLPAGTYIVLSVFLSLAALVGGLALMRNFAT